MSTAQFIFILATLSRMEVIQVDGYKDMPWLVQLGMNILAIMVNFGIYWMFTKFF